MTSMSAPCATHQRQLCHAVHAAQVWTIFFEMMHRR
jgi:hypothetical protein